MRNLQLLINQSRRATENVEFSDSTGIGNDEFIEYANNGQMSIQSKISNIHAEVFQSEEIVQITGGVEAYDIPSDAFLGNRIDMVEYSDDGGRLYFQLKQGRLPERLSPITSGTPSFYIRRSGKILLQPAPEASNGMLRITYQKSLPRLELRQGKVGAVTLDTSARTITSLTLDTTTAIGETELKEQNYVTIVDKFGTIKMKNIPISDVSGTSGTVTVDAGFVYEVGETIAVGDYILRGGFSTTHSQLPDICERYLISYMNWKIFKRDSSTDSQEETQELVEIRNEILETFAEPDRDVDYVTILDDQYMVAEDDY